MICYLNTIFKYSSGGKLIFLHPGASYLLIIIYLAKLKSERMLPDCHLSCLKTMEQFGLANYSTVLYSFFIKLPYTTGDANRLLSGLIGLDTHYCQDCSQKCLSKILKKIPTTIRKKKKGKIVICFQLKSPVCWKGLRTYMKAS